MLTYNLAILVVLSILVAAQYAAVYGFCILKFTKDPDSELQTWREETESTRDVLRVFGWFAAGFVFLILLIRQFVSTDSWMLPVLIPLWVSGAFLVMELAFRRLLKQ